MRIVNGGHPRFGPQRWSGVAACIAAEFSRPLTRPCEVFRGAEAVLTEGAGLDD